MSETARELLARADRERALARGCDAARRNYRLGRSAVAHRKTGLFGWLRDRSKEPDPKDFETVPAGAERAVYEALGIVEREANARADALEARVRTLDPTTPADRAPGTAEGGGGRG